MKSLLAFVLLTAAYQAIAAGGFAACPQFFYAGSPPAVQSKPAYRELCFESFAVLHNGDTRTPFYVAERLNKQVMADADEKRTNKFFAEARLPNRERAELKDYAGSGYAKGHMAPAADMPTPTAMAQSFSLANMVPQAPKSNSGAWAKIEKDTRRYVTRAQGDVFVITGPAYGSAYLIIGDNQVRIPQYLYKLVYDPSRNKAWAYWQENKNDARATAPISYQELVRRTGINYLPAADMLQ